jgi:hypothetical protein
MMGAEEELDDSRHSSCENRNIPDWMGWEDGERAPACHCGRVCSHENKYTYTDKKER